MTFFADNTHINLGTSLLNTFFTRFLSRRHKSAKLGRR